MFAKITSALRWVRTVRFYHRAQYPEFLDAIQVYEDKNGLEPYESTLKAYALLATDRFAEAEAMFSSVCRSVLNDSSDKSRYLGYISGGMIHKLNGRDSQAEGEFRKARLLSPGSLYTTMLPTTAG